MTEQGNGNIPVIVLVKKKEREVIAIIAREECDCIDSMALLCTLKKFKMRFSIFFDYAELCLRDMNFQKNCSSNSSTITLRQREKPKSHNKSLAWGKVRSSLRLTIYSISCHTFPLSILPLNDPIFDSLLYFLSIFKP